MADHTMSAIPINESEAIFARFMDPLRSGFERWSTWCEPACGATVEQFWQSVKVSWDRGGGKVVCSLERGLKLDIDAYDRLIVRASLPSSAHLTVQARCDRSSRAVIAGARGIDDYCEYEGPLVGGVLDDMQIEITVDGDLPGMALLQWLGVADEPRRRAMLERPSPFVGGWDDLVIGPDEPPAMQPQLELFFGTDELAALRARVQTPHYAAAMDGLREKARTWLGSEPALGVMTEYNLGSSIYGRDRDEPTIDMVAARLCAFVGLIDEDEKLMRTAVDHALAAVHCRDWIDGPIMTMPGATFEHRAFVAYRVASNTIYALDWCGGLLNEAGRQAIALALATKGLPACWMALERHDYMRGNNQGVYMAYGALLIEAALARLWPPHGGEHIDVAKAAIDETIGRYVADDGGAYEGAGYVSSTIGHALTAYQVYARHRGVPLADVVPERVLRTEHYFETTTSTVAPAGASVCVGDGGRPGAVVYPSFLGSLSALSGSDFMRGLLAGALPSAPERESTGVPGTVFAIVYGPDDLPAEPAVRPATFAVLPDTGQLCSCRETPQGPVRLQLVGAPAKAGHTHEDKGSFLIEAFGEEIAIDRGQISYNDPRHDTLKHAQFHNLLVPDTGEGLPARQVCPCPVATIPCGQGDETTVSCEIGGDEDLYPDLVESWHRAIDSGDPSEFEITDTMQLKKRGTVTFHLHSRHPWRREGSGWETRGYQAMLRVSPEWEPAEERGEEDFIDGYRMPAYHLTLRASAARTHELRTRLSVNPAPSR